MADNKILSKFESIKYRFDEVAQQITDPDVMKDMKRYVKLNQEYKRLDDLVKAFTEYQNIIANIASSKELLAEETDNEMREMAREEIDELESQIAPQEEKIKLLLVPSRS